MNSCLLCQIILLYTPFLPVSKKGKMTVNKRNSVFNSFSVGSLSMLKMNLTACVWFQCWHLRARSYWMSGGTCVKALCSLELAFGWWVNGVASVPTGTWGYGTVRFCKVLLKSPSNLNVLWVCFVSFLPNLAVQFSLHKWSNRVP